MPATSGHPEGTRRSEAQETAPLWASGFGGLPDSLTYLPKLAHNIIEDCIVLNSSLQANGDPLSIYPQLRLINHFLPVEIDLTPIGEPQRSIP